MNKKVKRNFKKRLAVLLLCFLWFVFKNGGNTIVGIDLNQSGDKAVFSVDGTDLYEVDIADSQKIKLSAEKISTFDTSPIDQRIKNFFIQEGSHKNPIKGQNGIEGSIAELKGKKFGVNIINLKQAKTILSLDDKRQYALILGWLRENAWSISLEKDSKTDILHIERHIPLDSWQQLKTTMGILILPIPLLIVLILLSGLKGGLRWPKFKEKDNNASLFIIFISLIAFFWLFYLNQHYLEGIPHVGDAITYLMQGKFLARGGVCGKSRIPQEALIFFKDWGATFFRGNSWCGFYPYGHPLMLAIGEVLGKPGIIPPLLASVSLFFLFLIGKKIGSWVVGVLAALIMLSSPFFQMNAASFMSHNSAIFYEIVGIYFLLRFIDSRKSRELILSALFLGLLFNTRPLTAIALSVPIIIYFLLEKVEMRKLLIFLLSCTIPFSFYFLYNFLSTGSWTKNPYFQMSRGLFTQGKTFLTNYIAVFQTHLLVFLKVFHGWPFLITLFLIFLPIFMIKKKQVIFFFLSLVSLTLAWSFYDGGTCAITYGPRFWSEIMPFTSVLMGFSINYLASIFKNNILKSLTYLGFVTLMVYTSLGWIKGKPVLWSNIAYTPTKINDLKTFNYIDARLIKLAKKMGIKNSVIFVKKCPGQWCYGSVIPQNNPALDSDIVWAQDLGERNLELMKIYPSRKFYLADYESNKIEEIRTDLN